MYKVRFMSIYIFVIFWRRETVYVNLTRWRIKNEMRKYNNVLCFYVCVRVAWDHTQAHLPPSMLMRLQSAVSGMRSDAWGVSINVTWSRKQKQKKTHLNAITSMYHDIDGIPCAGGQHKPPSVLEMCIIIHERPIELPIGHEGISLPPSVIIRR